MLTRHRQAEAGLLRFSLALWKKNPIFVSDAMVREVYLTSKQIA
jgi:hypothetical protein